MLALALATLTQFTNGLPSAGTLTIDDDANGRGWFIDTTPWENSEFAIQNTEYSSITTPDSAAYGRYDLLTTILHELGHLQGIISGNRAFDSIQAQYHLQCPGFSDQRIGIEESNDILWISEASLRSEW